MRALTRTLFALPRYSRAMASTTPVLGKPGAIILSEQEEKFVTLLDEFARNCEPPIECRIAGGWVRDKLLELPSHDLDIALSTPSGHAFAVAFVDFLHSRHGEVATGSVGRVAANPDQSKHLETGTTTIMGLELDFVGLRSETYTDSRIPDQVQLGTPLEDSLRRDLTINSLFFNVHSRQVEDWTKHGLEDLENKIARTPLPPRQTFLDDPLRVLRAVRFSSRFGLTIEPEVVKAVADQDIRLALKTKVSRERVGIETHKMIQKTPLRSIGLIDQLGLHSSIFTTTVEPPHPRGEAIKASQILDIVLQRVGHPGTDALWLAAAVCPFRDAIVEGKKPIPAVAHIIGEGLKLSNDDKNSVANLFDASKLLNPEATGRSEIGVILQHPSVRPWEQSFVWAIVERVLPTWEGQWTAEHEAILSKWLKFREHIVSLGLPEAIAQPPLVNGTEVQKLLSIRPGPLVRVIAVAVNEWQLDHPGATKEQCETWITDNWNGEGRAKWEASVPPPVNKTGKAAKRAIKEQQQQQQAQGNQRGGKGQQ